MQENQLWVYDIETYKYAFTFSIIRADGKFARTFEVSKYTNEIQKVYDCMQYLEDNACKMIGFNNIGFDYPVMHEIVLNKDFFLKKSGAFIAGKIFDIAQKQIDSFKGEGFGNTIKTDEQFVKQIDLYRIHHFNNKAKSTSLKMLEFNMRLENIEDLPYDIRQDLSKGELDKLKEYNMHDVMCTLEFFKKSKAQIQFREDLTNKLNRDFMNADDTKIGAEYFQMKLEESGIKLREYKNGKLVLRQSPRKSIAIKDCLFKYYKFTRPEFQAVYDWFSQQVITETKGVFSDIEEHNLGELAKYAELTVKRKKFKSKPSEFEIAEFKKAHQMGWIEEEELKATEYAFDANGTHIMEYALDEDGSPDLTKKPKKKRVPKKSYWGCWKVAETLNTVIDGFRFDFGTGGIHGSLCNIKVEENKSWLIRDYDVSSFYPNLAISNKVYPEHLGTGFCDIYKDMYEQRKSYAKNTAENAMLKLALNGTYGKSNDQYSVFYDPKFTMSITINGQLSLLLLVDMFYTNYLRFKMVMANTDGITVCSHRSDADEMNFIVKEWENLTKLTMESVDYSKMFIRDVNNYIAVYTNSKSKRKGAYQYEDLGYHQNQGGLVIQRAAEANLMQGIDIEEFIKKHFAEGNIFDFMLRVKVPRSSKLVLVMPDGSEVKQQNTCRYYVSNTGGKLVKLMPALEGKEEDGDRRLSIDAAYTVKTCNNMKDFDGDINFEYYVSEAKKLVNLS